MVGIGGYVLEGEGKMKVGGLVKKNCFNFQALGVGGDKTHES